MPDSLTTEGQTTGTSASTAPAAAPAAQPTVPAGLEKFVGENGALDPNKVAQSYLEVEKTLRQREAESAQLRQALNALSQNGSGTTPAQNTSDDPEAELRNFVKEPKAYIRGLLETMSAPLAKELSLTALKTKHPELNDQKFSDEVGQWVATLPPSIRAAEGSFDGADYLVTLYKEHKKGTSQPATGTNTLGPSASTPSGGKIFSRAEIRQLMTSNPAKYNELEPEISKAYAEGRVR